MDLIELIKAGKHTAIMEYLSKPDQVLKGEEDVALVQRGNHEEIMMAITHGLLFPAALDALIERGNLNEIRFLLSISPNTLLSFNAEKLIPLGRGVADAYVDALLAHTDCLNFQKVMTPLQIALIRMDDHCALRRYISKCKLTPEAYHLFLKEGIAEDFLVYRLAHSIKE